MKLRSIHSNLHHLCRKTHIILTWIYSICITLINFVLIVTHLGHLITDLKDTWHFKRIIPGPILKTFHEKHMQIIPAYVRIRNLSDANRKCFLLIFAAFCMTSTGEFVLLAPASHIIASDFIKLHLLHALLKSLTGRGEYWWRASHFLGSLWPLCWYGFQQWRWVVSNL